jgi:hypothetical protein
MAIATDHTLRASNRPMTPKSMMSFNASIEAPYMGDMGRVRGGWKPEY